MSSTRKLGKYLLVFLVSILLTFNGCSESDPLSVNGTPEINTTASNPASESLSKGGNGHGGVTEYSYPLFGSHTFGYWRAQDEYRGGQFYLDNGSRFSVVSSSITPPPSILRGENVTITMRCDKDVENNELIFTFGPSGTQFFPAAAVYLNWKDLNIDVPKLYYIDKDGNYIEQMPDDIDLQGKWLRLEIDHFSRYALAAD